MGDMTRRKLSWFDEGAAELRASFERRGLGGVLPAGEWYLCPCCPALHDRESLFDGSLTAEDVPPKSVGGRKILLTCKTCNNAAGEQIDHHYAKREVIEDFLSATDTGHRQRFLIHGPDASVEGEGYWLNGGLQFYGLPRNNHPDRFKRFFASMDRASQAGTPTDGQFSFTPQFPPIEYMLANISLIRAAYLAAFAVFGWPYILNEGMEVLREVFRNPDASVPPLMVDLDVRGSKTTRSILIVDEPSDLSCLAVTIGRRTVMLPSPHKLIDNQLMTFEVLKESFDQHKRTHATAHLSGKVVPWPSRALYWIK